MTLYSTLIWVFGLDQQESVHEKSLQWTIEGLQVDFFGNFEIAVREIRRVMFDQQLFIEELFSGVSASLLYMFIYTHTYIHFLRPDSWSPRSKTHNEPFKREIWDYEFSGLGRKQLEKNNENRHFVVFSGFSTSLKLLFILSQKLIDLSSVFKLEWRSMAEERKWLKNWKFGLLVI